MALSLEEIPAVQAQAESHPHAAAIAKAIAIAEGIASDGSPVVWLRLLGEDGIEDLDEILG